MMLWLVFAELILQDARHVSVSTDQFNTIYFSLVLELFDLTSETVLKLVVFVDFVTR